MHERTLTQQLKGGGNAIPPPPPNPGQPDFVPSSCQGSFHDIPDSSSIPALPKELIMMKPIETVTEPTSILEGIPLWAKGCIGHAVCGLRYGRWVPGKHPTHSAGSHFLMNTPFHVPDFS